MLFLPMKANFLTVVQKCTAKTEITKLDGEDKVKPIELHFLRSENLINGSGYRECTLLLQFNKGVNNVYFKKID